MKEANRLSTATALTAAFMGGAGNATAATIGATSGAGAGIGGSVPAAMAATMVAGQGRGGGGSSHDLFSQKNREKLALGPTTSGHGGNAPGKKGRFKARITVVVRKRPLSALEASRGEADIMQVPPLSKTAVTVEEPRKNVCGTPYIEPHEFAFDRAYDDHNTNLEVYHSCVKQLVEAVFTQGARCSCFTYGQTGSGKTYTMVGPKKLGSSSSGNPVQGSAITPHTGLLELAARDCFQRLQTPEFDYYYGLHIGFFEIYCNKVYDLLGGRRLVKALETKTADGVVVKDLTTIKVENINQLLKAVGAGLDLRVVGQNSKNNDSSRGHAVLTFEIRNEHLQSVFGKLAFIDLAGSERGADAMYSGKTTQVDGAGINRSLLALKECIRALDQQSTHIPFRDSELTKVLRDMFIGSRAKTLMIACVSPSSGCCEQTLNTLRYAERVRAIRRNCQPDVDSLEGNDGASPRDESCDKPVNTARLSKAIPRGVSATRQDQVLGPRGALADDRSDEFGRPQRSRSKSSERSSSRHGKGSSLADIGNVSGNDEDARVEGRESDHQSADRKSSMFSLGTSHDSDDRRGAGLEIDDLPGKGVGSPDSGDEIFLPSTKADEGRSGDESFRRAMIARETQRKATDPQARISARGFETSESGDLRTDGAAHIGPCISPRGLPPRGLPHNATPNRQGKTVAATSAGPTDSNTERRSAAVGVSPQKARAPTSVAYSGACSRASVGNVRLPSPPKPEAPPPQQAPSPPQQSEWRSRQAAQVGKSPATKETPTSTAPSAAVTSRGVAAALSDTARATTGATSLARTAQALRPSRTVPPDTTTAVSVPVGTILTAVVHGDVQRVFPPPEEDDMIASSRILRKRYKDLGFPVDPPANALMKKTGLPNNALQSKHLELNVAMEMLQAFLQLPTSQIHKFYTALSERIRRLYSDLIRSNVDCLKAQTCLGITQQKMLKDIDPLSRNGRQDVDKKYLGSVRSAIEKHLLLQLRLAKQVVDLERLLALQRVTNAAFRNASASEVEYFNQTSLLMPSQGGVGVPGAVGDRAGSAPVQRLLIHESSLLAPISARKVAGTYGVYGEHRDLGDGRAMMGGEATAPPPEEDNENCLRKVDAEGTVMREETEVFTCPTLAPLQDANRRGDIASSIPSTPLKANAQVSDTSLLESDTFNEGSFLFARGATVNATVVPSAGQVPATSPLSAAVRHTGNRKRTLGSQHTVPLATNVDQVADTRYMTVTLYNSAAPDATVGHLVAPAPAPLRVPISGEGSPGHQSGGSSRYRAGVVRDSQSAASVASDLSSSQSRAKTAGGLVSTTVMRKSRKPRKTTVPSEASQQGHLVNTTRAATARSPGYKS